jgi:hypothetical protein
LILNTVQEEKEGKWFCNIKITDIKKERLKRIRKGITIYILAYDTSIEPLKS